MSGFMSDKYRRLVEQDNTPIDEDRFCEACGYNLRGLTLGRACPECSRPISHHVPAGESATWAKDIRFGLGFDVILSGTAEERAVWRKWLMIGAWVMLIVGPMKVIALFGISIIPTVFPLEFYVALGCVCGLLWIGVTWKLTPRSIDEGSKGWKATRYTARALCLLWPVGYGFYIARLKAMPGGATEHVFEQVFCGLAGIGAIVMAAILHRVAVGADLESAAKRLNTVVFLLPIVGLVDGLVPTQIAWIAIVLRFAPALLWMWLVTSYGLALLEMSGHATWAHRINVDQIGRSERIDEARAEMDAEVAGRVRAAPRREDDGDIGLE